MLLAQAYVRKCSHENALLSSPFVILDDTEILPVKIFFYGLTIAAMTKKKTRAAG